MRITCNSLKKELELLTERFNLLEKSYLDEKEKNSKLEYRIKTLERDASTGVKTKLPVPTPIPVLGRVTGNECKDKNWIKVKPKLKGPGKLNANKVEIKTSNKFETLNLPVSFADQVKVGIHSGTSTNGINSNQRM